MTEGRLAPDEVRTRTFTRVVRGYKRRDVRRLLERAADDLDRLRGGPVSNGRDDEPPLTPEAIEEARFQPALGGYEMEEVDNFLDQLMTELERAAREPSRAPSALPAPPRSGLFPPRPIPVATATEGGPHVQPTVVRADEPMPGPGVEPGPGREPEVAAGPAAEPAVVREGGPAPEPDTGPAPEPEAGPAPGPEADVAVDQQPAERVEPPMPAPRPPASGPLPVSKGRPGAGPLPAAQPPPAAPSPATPPPAPEPEPAPPVTAQAPTWAVDEEGLFPPDTAPPSAAPAPQPPPPPSAQRPPTPAERPLTPSEVETRSFDRGAPGYLPTHVDLFLAKAARAMAGRDGETLTRWDVLRQRFPLGPRGYATSEVDAFLVRLAAQFPDPDPEAQEEILRKLLEPGQGAGA